MGVAVEALKAEMFEDLDKLAINNFQRYLRIKTVHPNPDYENCVKFLVELADELKLSHRIIEFKKGIPVILLTLQGSDPSLKSILLSSHYDVVPVSEEFWKFDPFGAEMCPNGDIVARGSQDMKCVGIAYLEAIRRIKMNSSSIFKRTIHLLFTPDEEIGSPNGAAQIIKSSELENLNIGACFDEGIPSPTNKFYVFNVERLAISIKILARGVAGHGSSLPQGTAIEKLLPVLIKFSEWRREETAKLVQLDGDLGSVNSINITMLSAGKQHNVIPETAEATIDIRLSPSFQIKEFEEMMDKFCDIDGVDWSYYLKPNICDASTTDPKDFYWSCLEESLIESNIDHEVKVFPGATDSRFYRSIGLPAYGISPFRNTCILAHDQDEYLNSFTFLEGINFYYKLIEKLTC